MRAHSSVSSPSTCRYPHTLVCTTVQWGRQLSPPQYVAVYRHVQCVVAVVNTQRSRTLPHSFTPRRPAPLTPLSSSAMYKSTVITLNLLHSPQLSAAMPIDRGPPPSVSIPLYAQSKELMTQPPIPPPTPGTCPFPGICCDSSDKKPEPEPAPKPKPEN